MKAIVSFLLIISASFCMNGQTEDQIKTLVFQNKDSLNNIVLKLEIGSLQQLVDSLTIPSIKNEYWDNTVYNPYKDVKVEFPVQIRFSDFSYSSPMSRDKVITSRYGWRNRKAHKGIDLITGDSVFAMFKCLMVSFGLQNTIQVIAEQL